jgi:hypothetical protein
MITLTLTRNQIGYILDALELRIEAYRHTAAYFNDGESEHMIEEVDDAEEAEAIASSIEEVRDCVLAQVRTTGPD